MVLVFGFNNFLLYGSMGCHILPEWKKKMNTWPLNTKPVLIKKKEKKEVDKKIYSKI